MKEQEEYEATVDKRMYQFLGNLSCDRNYYSCLRYMEQKQSIDDYYAGYLDIHMRMSERERNKLSIYEIFEEKLSELINETESIAVISFEMSEFPECIYINPTQHEAKLTIFLETAENSFRVKCTYSFQFEDDVNLYIKKAKLILEKVAALKIVRAKHAECHFELQSGYVLAHVISATFDGEPTKVALKEAGWILINQMLATYVLDD